MRPAHVLALGLTACAVEQVADDIDDTAAIDVPACAVDADCDDGNPCTGTAWCDDGTCEAGTPVTCLDGETCAVEGSEAVCVDLCELPDAPVLEVLHAADVLTFQGPPDLRIAVLGPADEIVDATWSTDPTVDLGDHDGPTRVVATADHASCAADERFDHTYDVQAAYPDAAGTPTSRAVDPDDVVAWATGVASYTPGEAVDAAWKDTDRGLGAAQGTAEGIVALGRGGQITLTFDAPIADGAGHDLAVFENGFDGFLEVAYVEVSSDGTTFARFDSAARTAQPVDRFGLSDPTRLHGLAGVYERGHGTPFDLSLLRHDVLVRTGQLDLDAVTHVRVVDVVGDGTDADSFGRTIRDPFPTVGSGGFDLDAVGVLHEATP